MGFDPFCTPSRTLMPEYGLIQYALVLLAGVCAGFLNIVAGGGSLITMPILIFLGLPSAVANGTNRIGLLVEASVGVVNFRRRGFFDPRYSAELALPAVAGAVLGSWIVIDIPDEVFNRLLAVVMIAVLALVLTKPGRAAERGAQELGTRRRILSAIAFFFVGLYGGFVQAGVGFIIIATLSAITRLSLVNINSIKVFVVGAYLVPSLAVFILNDKVDWHLGLTLGAGMGAGAWLGTVFTVEKGDRWIRVVLTIAVLGMAAKLAGVF